MDIEVVILSLILALTIVGLLFVACRELMTINRTNRPEGSFKLLIASSILASLVSDLIIQTNLLLSQASGGWPLGFASCEFWGYLSTVAMACSSWLITIIVIERCFTHLFHSDSDSTFSGRNTRITVTGVCLLVMMTVSGPFYGFGEYTFLRGYLNVIVTTNISLPLHSSHPDHSRVKLENLHQLFSHLQRSSYSSADTNLLTIIAQHLHNTYDVIVSKASWLPHGISFFIRSKNSETFQHFVDHYRDKLIFKNVTSISFIHNIARSLNISDTAVTANITNQSYGQYRQTFLPIQDLGICAADMSSPNQYSSVWNGFITLFILILPYGLALTGLCIIYCRGFGRLSSSHKHFSDQNVVNTNITCTIAMIFCALYLFHFAVELATGEGVDSGARLVFWSTYFVALKTLVYVVTLRISANTSSCTCSCDRKCCGCFIRKRRSMAYELSEIEIRRSLTRENLDCDS